MIVRELIEKLQGFPPDARAQILGGLEGGDVCEVRSVYLREDAEGTWVMLTEGLGER